MKLSPKLKANQPHLCLGFGEVCGHYSALQLGLTELNIASTHIKISEDPFSYPLNQKQHPLDRCLNKILFARRKFLKFPIIAKILGGLFNLIGCVLAVDAAIRYDGFIICAFTRHYKAVVLLARLCRKPIITVLHGSEIRPPFINGINFDLVQTPQELVRLTKSKLNLARFIERYSDFVISHPPQSQFLTKPYVNWSRIGIPLAITYQSDASKNQHVTSIVHAPSRPQQKGSYVFKSIILELKKKGHQIEYVELINKSNLEVLQQLSAAHIAIDELYSDNIMATYSTEASYYACVPVVSGYISASDLLVPNELIPPSIFCSPENVTSTLETLLNSPSLCRQKALDCQQFVKKNWTNKLVAARLMELLKNRKADPSWLVNPSDVTYVYGWGLSKEHCRKLAATFYFHASERVRKRISNPSLKKFCEESTTAYFEHK